MSLILNGGVSGSGTTQGAYCAPSLALPFTTVAYFKRDLLAPNTNGGLAHFCDASASVGTYRLGIQAAFASGPVANISSIVKDTTQSAVNVTPVAQQTITAWSIDTAEAVVDVADTSAFSVNDYVRLTGGSGLSPNPSGKEFLVTAINPNVSVTLSIAVTGTPTGTWYLNESAYQADEWMCVVGVFDSSSPTRGIYSALVGSSAFTHTSAPSSSNVATIFAACDRFCVGFLSQATDGVWLPGELAHVAVWSGVKASSTNALELLTVGPDQVTWGTPTAYWPLTANENDSIGSNHLTLVGSPSIDSSTPAIDTGGGGTPGFISRIMRSRRAAGFTL